MKNAPHDSRREFSPDPDVRPLDWARVHGAGEAVRRSVVQHVRRRRWRRVVLAGTGALMITAGAFTAWRVEGLHPAPAEAVVAGKARVIAPARRALPDGSVVELQRETIVDFEYTSGLRRVRLARGAAHFEVVKDPQRPFVVEAGGFGVRAVGTAFAVQLTGNEVEVLVTEGRVAVDDAQPARANAAPVTGASLGASERMVVNIAARTIPAMPAPVPPDEMRDRLAWRVPRLEFDGAPLSEVVTLFNAHARGRETARVELADESLKALPLSGALRADNIGVLLSILESSYGLKSRRGSTGELILYRP